MTTLLSCKLQQTLAPTGFELHCSLFARSLFHHSTNYTKYKQILYWALSKVGFILQICHNKTGEINPAKIQSLVEAYVKKFRKKHKLGLV